MEEMERTPGRCLICGFQGELIVRQTKVKAGKDWVVICPACGEQEFAREN